MSALTQLDKEHQGRIRELSHKFHKDRQFDIYSIFSHAHVAETIPLSKVILRCYNLERILSAFPFSTSVYVTICPNCPCVEDSRSLEILQHHGAIVPLLIRPYAEYPERFVKLILKHLHISAHEANFYRHTTLAAGATKIVCNHCIEERRREYSDIIRRTDFPPKALELLDDFLETLSPYIDPDYELVECFGEALKQDDREKMSLIHRVGRAVREARTTQAFIARSTIPSSCIPLLVRESGNVLPKLVARDVADVESALASEVHLDIPDGVDVDAFLECVGPYKDELAGIVDSIIEEASAKPSDYLTTLTSRTATLAEETRRLSKHKGLLVYRASCSFVANNKALLASGLLATMFGLTGNPLGCGVSLASGVGAHIGKKVGKLRMPQEAKMLIDEVKHSVRPYAHKLLAKYLNIDIRAVQMWDISSGLQAAGTRRKTTPTKRSNRTTNQRRVRRR